MRFLGRDEEAAAAAAAVGVSCPWGDPVGSRSARGVGVEGTEQGKGGWQGLLQPQWGKAGQIQQEISQDMASPCSFARFSVKPKPALKKVIIKK